MTGWQLFVGARENCMTPIIFGLLLLCIVWLIRELTKGWPGKGG